MYSYSVYSLIGLSLLSVNCHEFHIFDKVENKLNGKLDGNLINTEKLKQPEIPVEKFIEVELPLENKNKLAAQEVGNKNIWRGHHQNAHHISKYYDGYESDEDWDNRHRLGYGQGRDIYRRAELKNGGRHGTRHSKHHRSDYGNGYESDNHWGYGRKKYPYGYARGHGIYRRAELSNGGYRQKHHGGYGVNGYESNKDWGYGGKGHDWGRRHGKWHGLNNYNVHYDYNY